MLNALRACRPIDAKTPRSGVTLRDFSKLTVSRVACDGQAFEVGVAEGTGHPTKGT
jgi:hypothetical protein